MATSQQQSKLHRRIPALVLVALSVLLATTGAAAAWTSPHQADSGSPFFMLADSGFSAQQTARVRIEGDPQTFAEYGGVDVLVYRIPHPLTFLAGQKDLHRVQIKGHYVGEGLGNTLSYLWDKWFAKSRMLWQQLFTTRSRSAVVATAPQLKQAPPQAYHVHYDHPPQYAPLKQFPLVERFRYPVQQAKPIGPPKGTVLEGSSSNFIAPPPGNVYVPLGKLKPGLYLVEAYVGAYRAVTTLFVADTVGVTKVTHDHMLVWTANKTQGTAARGVKVLWSDGHGILAQGKTGSDGLLDLTHTAPQTSYVIGKDPAGGVFISENFYYDSEVYGERFYIFSDRPLYKPGDTVHVKIFARDYLSARDSQPVPAGHAVLSMIDAAGRELLSRPVTLNPVTGAAVDLPLPDYALPGGYQLRLHYHHHDYTGMFRVARYSKPQFRIDIHFAQPSYHPGDTIKGSVVLHYPDGRPVTQATVDLHIRAQALSMTDNDVHSRFVHQLAEQALKTDAHGIAQFTLPAAAVASRYTLRAVATKYGAFPVSAREQLTLQPGPLPETLTATSTPAGPGSVGFVVKGQAQNLQPAYWTAIRLQDRQVLSGKLSPPARTFAVTFKQPGGYSLFVYAADGSVLARSQIRIPGQARMSAIGLRLSSDHAHYRIGDVAHVTLNFPQPVDDALLTLERDQVLHASLASHDGSWYKLKRISPTRWQVAIPIKDNFAPNVTFSVLYVRNGDFEFQNLGLQVHLPPIKVQVKTNRQHYRPGDLVTVDLTTTREGKPVSAVISAAVVDNAVYVLQPELAPSIYDFFFHPLRDSVRTTASLAFYGYDLAWSPKAAMTGPDDNYYREGKLPTLQARPRRDNIDTAAWKPALRSDAAGHAHFSFVMPDALSRWRITARAMTTHGNVGQTIAYVTSSKPYYLKWAGPKRFRAGSSPDIGLLAYNEGDTSQPATLEIRIGQAKPTTQPVTLAPGSNMLRMPLKVTADTSVHLSLLAGNTVLDALDVPITVVPTGWLSWHSRIVMSNAPLALPSDASDIQLEPAATLSQVFAGDLDALMDTPFGNAEQTSSRLIALSIALAALPHDDASHKVRERLEQRTLTERERLMRLAGPGARFTWWKNGAGSYPLLTIYAYYADWQATRALGVELPPAHWQRVFDAYQRGASMPLLYRALSVHMIQSMGLPVKTLLSGLADDLHQAVPVQASDPIDANTSVIYSAPDSPAGHALAMLLYQDAARRANVSVTPELTQQASAASKALAGSPSPLVQDLASLLSGPVSAANAQTMLSVASREAPSMERALILSWLAGDAEHTQSSVPVRLSLGTNWQTITAGVGLRWRYLGSTPPKALPEQTTPAIPLRVSYRSADAHHKPLAVAIQRHLYKLVPGREPGTFDAHRVHGPLEADALYIDEVVLRSHVNKPLRFGILQVPLPAGAHIETQRYGFSVDDLSIIDQNYAEYTPLDVNGNPVLSAMSVLGHEDAQVMDDYYNDPIETLPAHGSITVRHLIRFQQPGRFHLPPARYYRMYQPDAKAIGPHAGHDWVIH